MKARIPLRMMIVVIVVGAWLAPFQSPLHGQTIAADLDGRWNFALDPLNRGEEMGWNKPAAGWTGAQAAASAGWDPVDVPHCFSVDPRFDYTGKVWYRRSIKLENQDPSLRYEIAFDAVYYRCRIWLNGTLVGQHEGGYTPFSIDVTKQLLPGRYNLIAVEVDNSWDMHTLPGARPGTRPDTQLFPWWNYGGITRHVRLLSHSSVYVANQKIETFPDLNSGSARISVSATIKNTSDAAQRARLRVSIVDSDARKVADVDSNSAEVPPGKSLVVSSEIALDSSKVKLWQLDAPVLYGSTAALLDAGGAVDPASSNTARFGIRSIEARDAKLLLNGRPVRLAGANRVADYPGFGSIEPDVVVQKDLQMMKAAHLELARLQHQPLAKNVLDWADEHGMLIIAECANWGFPSEQMSDPVIREKFRQQMTEMVEADWNHPSIIGWSVGNEYESWTAQGLAWTKDMKAFVKSLDDSRLVTFIAVGGATSRLPKPTSMPSSYNRESDSFNDADILCVNIYSEASSTAQRIDAVHRLWPDKPILLTEFGQRADSVKNEQDRIVHFEQILTAVRERDFVCGMSYWTFNDYRSRYPGTNVNGYRPWGMVDPERKPRALYDTVRDKLMPAALQCRINPQQAAPGVLHVEITGRKDFPSFEMNGLKIQVVAANDAVLSADTSIAKLAPGQTVAVDIPLPTQPAATGELEIRLVSAGGTVVGRSVVSEKP